jgi:hypothetical protein
VHFLQDINTKHTIPAMAKSFQLTEETGLRLLNALKNQSNLVSNVAELSGLTDRLICCVADLNAVTRPPQR